MFSGVAFVKMSFFAIEIEWRFSYVVAFLPVTPWSLSAHPGVLTDTFAFVIWTQRAGI
jgi:hypothetical protein